MDVSDMLFCTLMFGLVVTGCVWFGYCIGHVKATEAWLNSCRCECDDNCDIDDE